MEEEDEEQTSMCEGRCCQRDVIACEDIKFFKIIIIIFSICASERGV